MSGTVVSLLARRHGNDTAQRLSELFEAERAQSRWHGGLVVQARAAIASCDFHAYDDILLKLRGIKANPNEAEYLSHAP